MTPEITIVACRSPDQPGWLAMRRELWPDASAEEHRKEMARLLAQADRSMQVVSYSSDGTPCGFAEATLRTDYVNGTKTSPVVFLEGVFVAAAYRRRGIARRLVQAVAEWGAASGCSEFASDVLAESELSLRMHRALGFEETERVVYFRKPIG